MIGPWKAEPYPQRRPYRKTSLSPRRRYPQRKPCRMLSRSNQRIARWDKWCKRLGRSCFAKSRRRKRCRMIGPWKAEPYPQHRPYTKTSLSPRRRYPQRKPCRMSRPSNQRIAQSDKRYTMFGRPRPARFRAGRYCRRSDPLLTVTIPPDTPYTRWLPRPMRSSPPGKRCMMMLPPGRSCQPRKYHTRSDSEWPSFCPPRKTNRFDRRPSRPRRKCTGRGCRSSRACTSPGLPGLCTYHLRSWCKPGWRQPSLVLKRNHPPGNWSMACTRQHSPWSRSALGRNCRRCDLLRSWRCRPPTGPPCNRCVANRRERSSSSRMCWLRRSYIRDRWRFRLRARRAHPHCNS
jgi:hypothetical protein